MAIPFIELSIAYEATLCDAIKIPSQTDSFAFATPVMILSDNVSGDAAP